MEDNEEIQQLKKSIELTTLVQDDNTLFDEVPMCILEFILSFVEKPKDQLNARRVCKKWSILIDKLSTILMEFEDRNEFEIYWSIWNDTHLLKYVAKKLYITEDRKVLFMKQGVYENTFGIYTGLKSISLWKPNQIIVINYINWNQLKYDDSNILRLRINNYCFEKPHRNLSHLPCSLPLRLHTCFQQQYAPYKIILSKPAIETLVKYFTTNSTRSGFSFGITHVDYDSTVHIDVRETDIKEKLIIGIGFSTYYKNEEVYYIYDLVKQTLENCVVFPLRNRIVRHTVDSSQKDIIKIANDTGVGKIAFNIVEVDRTVRCFFTFESKDIVCHC